MLTVMQDIIAYIDLCYVVYGVHKVAQKLSQYQESSLS